MKMFVIFMSSVFCFPIIGMGYEERKATEEIKSLFRDYKEKELSLQEEYQRAIKEYQRSKSPENERRLQMASSAIRSPTLEIRKRLRHPNNLHFDPSKIDSEGFNLIVRHIVAKKGE